MKRPALIPGYVQNWMVYADWLEAKVAEYEYPLRTNGWVKVRGEVWDRVTDENAKLRKALERMATVLCDPEGKCCIDGSDADRAVIDLAMTALEAADG
jgi:hypothetical protein